MISFALSSRKFSNCFTIILMVAVNSIFLKVLGMEINKAGLTIKDLTEPVKNPPGLNSYDTTSEALPLREPSFGNEEKLKALAIESPHSDTGSEMGDSEYINEEVSKKRQRTSVEEFSNLEVNLKVWQELTAKFDSFEKVEGFQTEKKINYGLDVLSREMHYVKFLIAQANLRSREPVAQIAKDFQDELSLMIKSLIIVHKNQIKKTISGLYSRSSLIRDIFPNKNPNQILSLEDVFIKIKVCSRKLLALGSLEVGSKCLSSLDRILISITAFLAENYKIGQREVSVLLDDESFIKICNREFHKILDKSVTAENQYWSSYYEMFKHSQKFQGFQEVLDHMDFAQENLFVQEYIKSESDLLAALNYCGNSAHYATQVWEEFLSLPKLNFENQLRTRKEIARRLLSTLTEPTALYRNIRMDGRVEKYYLTIYHVLDFIVSYEPKISLQELEFKGSELFEGFKEILKINGNIEIDYLESNFSELKRVKGSKDLQKRIMNWKDNLKEDEMRSPIFGLVEKLFIFKDIKYRNL